MAQAGDTAELERMASQSWRDWRTTQEVFPIAAWGYFSRSNNDGSSKEFQRYAQAGLTMISTSQRQYDKATAAGLQVLVGGWKKLHENDAALKRVIEFNNGHSKVTGYQLMDEPSPDLFEPLARAMETIYHLDKNNTLPIIDLLPNWAWQWEPNKRVEKFGCNYDTFIRKFVETVHPPVLLNCHYPTMNDGTDKPEFYANLETFRKHALANDIGLMGFVLINEHKRYRNPSESDIYWQVYSCLAYGSQGIWYYNWRIKPSDSFNNGLVVYETLEPTPAFHVVKEVNRQIRTLSSVLMKLESTNVFHVGKVVPPGTARYPDEGIPGSCSIEQFGTDDFIIGEFINQDDPGDESTYVMLVNKRHGPGLSPNDSTLIAEALFKPTVNFRYVYRYDTGDGSLKLLQPTKLNGKDGYYRFNIPGGQGALLRFSNTPLI
ncbi:hypothetical protein OAS39_00855 [Pirellulales bacterium]|nr:hypothetical protein [Pirellulales bacterium]